MWDQFRKDDILSEGTPIEQQRQSIMDWPQPPVPGPLHHSGGGGRRAFPLPMMVIGEWVVCWLCKQACPCGCETFTKETQAVPPAHSGWWQSTAGWELKPDQVASWVGKEVCRVCAYIQLQYNSFLKGKILSLQRHACCSPIYIIFCFAL